MQGIYREIQKEYDDNRKRALDEAQAKKDAVYKEHPELKEVDDEINKIGVSMSKAIIFIDNDAVRNAKIEELKKNINELKDKKAKILKKLKLTEEYFEPVFTCNVCQDTGTVGSLEGAKLCNCFRQKIINHTYNKTQMYIIDKENFDTFDEKVFSDKVDEKRYKSEKSPRENILNIKKRSEEFVEKFSDEDNKNLIFIGGTGLGKTFMSNCIAKAAIDSGKTVLYQTAGKLMDMVMDYRMNRDNGEIDATEYNELFEVDLLIIDDLGTENVTEARLSELFNIINTRLINGKKKGIRTLISTNKELKDLMSYYDQRIVSRILGNFDVYRFFGEDIRLKTSGK
ncbi:MAG: ATP-binding protein [Clostridia bacterium]|nr:ATP-binding protein [Clostridia bacterium]